MMGTEHIKNIALLDGAEVNAVFDPVDTLAAEAATLAGGASIAPTFEAIIKDETLDALVIVSPNFLHVDQLEAICNARSIPVLCEKPLFSNPNDETRVQNLIQNCSERIWVAMEYRYMPPIKALREEVYGVTDKIELLTIKEHRFPFLEKIDNWNRFNENTGGTMVEKCCHFFDLMRLLLGAEPVRVSASAGQIANHLDEKYDGRTPNIWDAGYVIYDFDNGSRAMLELCMFADGSKWQEEITAIGHKGKIECRLPGPHRFWPKDIGPQPEPEVSIYPRHPINPTTRKIKIDENLLKAGDHHGSTFYQHQRFLEVVKGIEKPEVSLSDGHIAVIMGLAAQRAASEKRVVELSEFKQ